MAAQCGIYRIVNATTGDTYVGQSVDIDRRWRAHRSALANGRHGAQRLQRSWSKYGEDAFQFEVLETCQREHLTIREQFWMDACRPAFNQAPAAGSNFGLAQRAESVARRAAANRGRKRTPEQCERIRLAKQGHGVGRKQPADIVEKRIAPLRGRRRPDVAVALGGRARPPHVVAALKAANDERYAERRDRVRAAIAKHPEMSIAALARLTGCDREMVGKYKRFAAAQE